MASFGECAPGSSGASPCPATLRRRWLQALVSDDAHAGALVLVAGVPVLAGIWAILSPGRIFSREMTWDFLFNLSGAWHLHYGHVPHVDFHEPVGELNFLLTLLGFRIFGPTPLAFLAGVVVVALTVFMLASWAAWRRLPLAPASVFVVFTGLLVLMPASVGDLANAYSFAMSYNRYGWSALSILTLILFVPPRNGRSGDWLDIGVAGLLLVAMFYLKVTYFMAGLAALGFAMLVCPHIRSRWQAWAVAGGLTVANAVAPYSQPYLADIWDAAQAGGIRSSLSLHLNIFFAKAAEYAPYGAAFVVTSVMWLHGRAPLRLAMTIAFIVVIGLWVLSQNAQPDGFVLGVVIAFLLYDQLRQRLPQATGGTVTSLMLALLVFPLFFVGTSSASLAGYYVKATSDERRWIVDRTQLQGLVVPAEDSGLLAAFSHGQVNYQLFRRARTVGPRYELSPFEYVETLLEAAALLQDGGYAQYGKGGVVLLDQVNPLPFMIGASPPRGGNLWSGLDRPRGAAAELFADADHVLIPKFSTRSAWTEAAMIEYGPYLAAHFPYCEENQTWILLSRADAAVGPRDQLPPAKDRQRCAVGFPKPP